MENSLRCRAWTRVRISLFLLRVGRVPGRESVSASSCPDWTRVRTLVVILILGLKGRRESVFCFLVRSLEGGRESVISSLFLPRVWRIDASLYVVFLVQISEGGRESVSCFTSS